MGAYSRVSIASCVKGLLVVKASSVQDLQPVLNLLGS